MDSPSAPCEFADGYVPVVTVNRIAMALTTLLLLSANAHAVAPTAVDDSFPTTNEDTAVLINAVANDIDNGGMDPTSAAVQSQASNGTAVSNGNGTFTYTPDSNFNGNDGFDYRVCDIFAACDTATVSVSVTPVNDDPVAANDSRTVAEDSSGNSLNVTVNDTDVDGDSLNVIAASASNGTATPSGGNIVYTPNPGYVGSDTINYTVGDGNGGSDTASVSVTVSNVNDAPDAVDDTATVNEDSNNNQLDVTNNDTDPDGDNLTVTAASAPNGTAVPNNDRVRYTPDADFFGIDTISYTISDGNGGTDSASVIVTVNNVNDAPDAVNDNDTVAEDSSNNSINVTANDTDADGDSLTVSSASAGSGTATPAGGNVSYTPQPGFVGNDTINYTVVDGNGGSDSASVSISVTNVNDPPVANDDIASVSEDSTNNLIDVADNDTDIDGDNLAVSAATAANGAAVPAGANVRYTPNPGYVGADTINYTISDGNGGTDTAIVSVTVTNTNDIPVANDDSATVSEDSSNNTIRVTDNDTDEDGDTLVVTSASALNGTATPSGDSVRYTPNADYFGNDTITYTVSDGNGGTDSASVAVTVTGQPDAPVANDDSATVQEDSTNNIIPVTSNDTDADGDTLTVASATASNGTVTRNGGDVTYSPDADFFGSDTINYTVTDGNGGSDMAVVNVTVDAVNDLPVITGQVVVPLTTPEETELLIALTDITATDADNSFPDDFVLEVRPGSDYSVSGNRIIPATDFNGILDVAIRINDGTDNSAPFDLAVEVTPVNDVPLVTDQSELDAPEDSSLPIQIEDLTVVDPDNVFPGEFSLTVLPGLNYTVSFNTITPEANFNGILTVPVVVTDSMDVSPQFDLVVTIDPVNDAPLSGEPIADQQATENSLFSLDISQGFSDVDGNVLNYVAAGLPAVFTLDPQSGLITGTPVFEDTSDTPFTVTITASDGGAEGDATQTFSLTVAALGRANVGLTISAAPDPAMLNDQVQWTFTAANTGPETAEFLELTGSIVGTEIVVAPVGTSVCSIQPPVGDITGFTCTLNDVPNGGSTSAVVASTTGAAGDVFVSATATITELLPIDPNLDNNAVQASVGVAESFSNGTVQTLGTANAGGIAAGDVDGDGFVDLVVGTAAGQSVEIYLSTGFRSFVDAPVLVPDNSLAQGVVLADIDNDGDLDLILANGGGLPDVVYANDGVGTFSLITTLGSMFSQDVAAVDVDNDGNLDLVFAAVSGNPVYIGDGVGGFTLRDNLGVANSIAVAFGDLNGDTWTDLVFANTGGASAVWLNDAGAGFSPGAQLMGGDMSDVVASDLDGNGSVDLAFARTSGTADDLPGNPIYLNDGSAGMTLSDTLGAAPTIGIHAGDIDGDSIVDLVFVNASGVHQSWRGTGTGFALNSEQIVAQDGRCGVLADLGNDGGLDLALGGPAQSGTDVFLNDGFGNLGRGDAVPPVLNLVGEPLLDIPSGSPYNDAGATADDNIDGDISNLVVVSNTVNVSVVGTYTVTYNVTDFAGNPATPITRSVNVLPAAGSGGGGGGAFTGYWILLLSMFTMFSVCRVNRVIIRNPQRS